jgi:hypothetical protein
MNQLLPRLPSDTELPDGIFQTKHLNLGKFWRVLQLKMLVYFMDIRPILWQFRTLYGHLLYFVVIG